MSHKYLSNVTTPPTQSDSLPGQVQNSASGYSYPVSDWTRLSRFLILGSEGGSYYASEQKLTRDNAQAVQRCIAADGPRVVATVADISDKGRAAKNDPAILVLAMCAKLGNDETRRAAYQALPVVCRIGTHLYHFVQFADQLGGWGRGMRRAVAAWFNNREPEPLARQLVKYQQRDGWSSGDVLRLSHPKPRTPAHQALYQWATKGEAVDGLPSHVVGYEAIKKAATLDEVVALVAAHELPREAIPTQWLTQPRVWEAMLPRMGLTAMIRNLATMTRIGLIAPGSDVARSIASSITDVDKLRAARVHPIALLSALRTYQAGRSVRGDGVWSPVRDITDALDAGFYAAFGVVQPSGKRVLLGIDVSGSMAQGEVAGVAGLTPREAAVAMAMVTAAVEPSTVIMGFTGGFVPLDISPRRRLDDNLRAVSNLGFERTDCAQPMIYADTKKLPIDLFVVYTDSETWCGAVHPRDALRRYRRSSGIAAKSAVVAMLSNPFTIADPEDAGQLDVVGFDTATPSILTAFARGE